MIEKAMHLKSLNVFLVGVLVLQLTGCGTLLYPERKGQKDGRIDTGVAILDGIGLLFFIIPGAIAFAVDFNNGTIYLPGTSRVMANPSQLTQVKFDPHHTSLAALAKIIKDKTGYQVCLTAGDVQVAKLKSTAEMMTRFAQASGLQNERIALLY